VSSALPQPVVAKLTRAAIFLVVTLKPEPRHREAIRALCGDLAALLRAVGFRDLTGRLSCVMAFGSDAWDLLFGQSRPIDLHPFREINARSPHRIEQMLTNMFVGRPPGNYDRLLDYSKAVTGTLFFVPSATFQANVVPDDV
jgi:deferrochelatase/peroxidase EfeB